MSSKPILIAGAGPAGLSLACALADAGWHSIVLDPLDADTLAAPPDDGREIALTHRSMDLMQQLGLWQDLAPQEIAPLRSARVVDGGGPASLSFRPETDVSSDAAPTQLGALVSNHAIRRAAWQGAQRRAQVQLRPGCRVERLQLRPQAASLTLSSGETLDSPLLVAADGRFSALRRQAGIATRMLDFGRSVLCCRVEHEQPHEGEALECFHHGHTMAWLPLHEPHTSSLVLTLAADQAQRLLAMDDAALLDWVDQHAQGRRGRLLGLGPRHHYPLVATYAQRFASTRLALLGDAAVGMHPVTAHGFNFGLYGAQALCRQLQGAADPGAAALLQAFDQAHRRQTQFIYHGTNALVKLFTEERGPAPMLRQGLLRLAQQLPPLRRAITAQLTGRDVARSAGPLDRLGPLGRLLASGPFSAR